MNEEKAPAGIDVERVDYIRVPVKDIEEAKRFYGEVLGLPPQTHDYEFSPLPSGTLALRVPDVANAKATLEAAGIHVTEMWDSGKCHGAGVSDPSGNPILLHHRYAAYPDSTRP